MPVVFGTLSLPISAKIIVHCVRLTAAVEPGEEVTVRCGRYIHQRTTTTTAATTTTVLLPSSSTTTATTTPAAAATTTATASVFTDTTSSRYRRSDPHTSPQTLPTPKSPRSPRIPAKKSAWQRVHYKTGGFVDRTGRPPSSAKVRAKLHRLAQKFATVSDNSVNGINKPSYEELLRSEDNYRSRSTYWKSLQEGAGYYKPRSAVVEASGNQNETGAKVTAPGNVTYSETVHDHTAELSVGDGQTSVLGATEKSTIGKKRQTESETNNGSAADALITNENSTKVDITRKRHIEVESNEMPTFSHAEPTATTNQKPERLVHNSEINKRNKFYHLAKEGGPHRPISRNEIYSKVGRDPPFWVPVEPIQQEPFLREPAQKDIEFEEPYEPIPPLAKNDIGRQTWKPNSKIEPEEVTPPVNVSEVRQRPEAKEGGPSQLMRKIASPLEQEWIQKAEVAATTNATQPISDFRQNTTAGQATDPILTPPSEFTANNRTQQKLQHGDDNVQTDEEKPRINPDENDCATPSWKNVQLVQDSLSGGYYVIQEKIRANCPENNAAKSNEGQKQTSVNADGTLESERHGLTRSTLEQSHSNAPNPTDDNRLLANVGKAGWMRFDADGNLVKDIHHQDEDSGVNKPSDLSSVKDSSRDLLNSTDISDDQVQLPVDSPRGSDFPEDLVRYYIIQQHRQLQKRQDSALKDHISSWNTDHLSDEELTDLISNGKVVQTSNGRNPEAVLWQLFPIMGQESPRSKADSGFRIGDRSNMDLQQDEGSPKSTGEPGGNFEFSNGHTTSETVRAFAPAAFHADSRVTSISGQSITWGT